MWVDNQRIKSDDFVKKINEGLAGRQWLVLVMTPDALRSEWVEAEVNAALHRLRQRRMSGVIPIVAKPCDDEDIPPLWGTLHRYYATDGYEAARDGLLRAMGLTPVAAIEPPDPVESPATDTLATALIAPPAPEVAETREAALPGADAVISPPEPTSVEAQRVEAPQPESAPAEASVEPPTAPSPKPRPHGRAPALTWARPGIGVALVAVVALVVALVATQGFGLIAKGGSSSRPIPAPTQTARAQLAQSPTIAYEATAPGSCDNGPLAGQWSSIPERSDLKCVSDTAQVNGPALLTFSGNGGFAIGSYFSIALSDLRSDSKAHCLDFIIGAPRLAAQDRGEVHERLCPSGTLSGGSAGGIFNDEITSNIAPTNGSVILGVIVTSDTWTLLINGKTLASKAFNPSDTRPSSLNVVQIQVDTGASVTLFDLKIRPATT